MPGSMRWRGILAALRHRDLLSAQGRHIDVSLLDSQVAAQSHIAMNWLVSGQMPARNGTASMINTPWQAFETADRPLMLAVGNDKQFRALCRVLGRAELAEDQRYARNAGRMEHAQTLLPTLAAALRARPAAEWMALLEEVGVSAGPLNDFGAMAEDPQVQHRGMLRAMAGAGGAVVPTVSESAALRWRRARCGASAAAGWGSIRRRCCGSGWGSGDGLTPRRGGALYGAGVSGAALH